MQTLVRGLASIMTSKACPSSLEMIAGCWGMSFGWEVSLSVVASVAACLASRFSLRDLPLENFAILEAG